MKTSTSIQSNNRTIEQSNNFRRGSALLIVLGMLSFMVVSAVGFSIYMRQGRAPSSYLRRNVASRYLVKAALANAIEDLDGGFMSQFELGVSDNNNPEIGYLYGIYDDPYPGIGTQMDENTTELSNGDNFTKNGNFWFKRVFCPFGTLMYPQNLGEAVDEPSETVPTLTLEALAYLPPAIIDDVRKVSRLTRTAKWKSLPYQTGRYAYTAVNVSDLLDINRLQAGEPRNSGRDRISLSSLTSGDPEDPSAVDEGRAAAIDLILDQIEQFKINGYAIPFTSLAEFNLMAANSAYAPFMKYVGTGNAAILQPGSVEAANAMFVTDTWFPSTNEFGKSVFNLGGVDGDHQPFKKNGFVASSFIDVAESCENEKDQVGLIFERNLGIGMTCLYDYLDSDSVPISLALPTTEAVPMIVGVSAPHSSADMASGFKVDMGQIGEPVVGEYTVSGYYFKEDVKVPVPAVKIQRTCTQIGITSFGRVKVLCLAAYPFKRMVKSERFKSGDFKIRGIMKAWLAPAGMGCRPSVLDALYPTSLDIMSSGNINASAAGGVATFRTSSFLSGKSFTDDWSDDVRKGEDALKELTLDFDNLDLEMPIFWQVTETIVPDQVPGYQLQLDKPELCSTDPYLALGNMNSASIKNSLRPLQNNGDVDAKWKEIVDKSRFNINEATESDAKGVTRFNEAELATQNFRLYAAVWVQIVDKNGNVVDMVPACLSDDKEWLNKNPPNKGRTQQICGDGAPLLNFMSDQPIVFNKDIVNSDALKAPKFTAWNELYAVDPRFNFAPEDWYSKQGDASNPQLKETWIADLGLKSMESPILGQDGRDRDIFMFVSDQEYLQSIGELQFLPRLERFRPGNGDNIFLNGFDYSPNFNGEAFDQRKDALVQKNWGKFANGDLFWRTYSGYVNSMNDNDEITGTKYANPYKMLNQKGEPVTFVSDAGTFKLNPFTEDDRILAAALVNTPYDYYVASTNDNQQQSGGKKNMLLLNNKITLQTQRSTYSFGQSSVAKFDDKTIVDIMDAFRESFVEVGKKGGKADWSSIWQDLEWQREEQNYINENNNEFLGVNVGIEDGERLHGVDRKYLYSFWRDCFDNSQQLFLIFVRAEPSSVGAGAAGGVSAAQLGGRAVALVWRDPSIPIGVGGGTRPDRRNITSRDAFRDLKSEFPSHRTRVLFYHQFD